MRGRPIKYFGNFVHDGIKSSHRQFTNVVLTESFSSNESSTVSDLNLVSEFDTYQPSLLDELHLRVKNRPLKHIILPEGNDKRVQEAAYEAVTQGLAKVTLFVESPQEAALIPHVKGVNVIVPNDHSDMKRLASEFYAERLKKKSNILVKDTVDPHYFANLLVKDGQADGVVAGALLTTGDVVRSAIQCIGPATGNSVISSFFIIEFPENHPRAGAVLFADCGINAEPTAEQLAEITLQTASSANQLLSSTALPPRVSMLSFSTHGILLKRTELISSYEINELKELIIDGELQFDAAVVPDIAKKKAPQSAIQGNTNVFVFPNLDAGNIAYKMAERFAGAKAIGPILQGLKKPSNDLSRGCDISDIIHSIVITSLQS
eukprot:GSMAST32.ASY1.ANO1.488.1 assembled CDS